jgi:hypothetical protein
LSAHSPGPWFIEPDDSIKGWHGDTYRVTPTSERDRRARQGSSARPWYVATVYATPGPRAERTDNGLANAALIAAAPELLERLNYEHRRQFANPFHRILFPDCRTCALLARLNTGPTGGRR